MSIIRDNQLDSFKISINERDQINIEYMINDPVAYCNIHLTREEAIKLHDWLCNFLKLTQKTGSIPLPVI